MRIAASRIVQRGSCGVSWKECAALALVRVFAASRNRVATFLSLLPESPSGAAVHVMPDDAEPGGDAIIVYAARDGY